VPSRNPPPLAPARVISASVRLEVRDLGLIGYVEAMALQDHVAEQRLNNAIPDTLLLLEHEPVITLGRRGSLEDVFLSEQQLNQQGIAVARSTRGGLVTYHGPGQLVGYPIVQLRTLKLTVPCYVRALELAIIDALAQWDIEARIDEDHVGVWTSAGKIAAIGVAQRHGVTLHGFAVNLQPDLNHFALINPCGIGALGVTSAASLLGHSISMPEFKATIVDTLEHHLTRLSAQRCTM
jgi:lipoate-protein ligase B